MALDSAMSAEAGEDYVRRVRSQRPNEFFEDRNGWQEA